MQLQQANLLESLHIKYVSKVIIYRPPTATSTNCARARCRQGEVPRMPRQRWHKGLVHPHFYRYILWWWWRWWWCWWWSHTRAWLPLPSTGSVDDDANDDATTLTQGLWTLSLLHTQSDAWKDYHITALFQCLSSCQIRILKITSYLIVSIRFHSWLFSIWALQAPVDIRDISCLGVPFGSIPGDRHTSSQLQNWVTH